MGAWLKAIYWFRARKSLRLTLLVEIRLNLHEIPDYTEHTSNSLLKIERILTYPFRQQLNP